MLFVTHPEDRATRGRDLSAEVGTKTDGRPLGRPFLLSFSHPDWSNALNPGGSGAEPPCVSFPIPYFFLPLCSFRQSRYWAGQRHRQMGQVLVA